MWHYTLQTHLTSHFSLDVGCVEGWVHQDISLHTSYGNSADISCVVCVGEGVSAGVEFGSTVARMNENM